MYDGEVQMYDYFWDRATFELKYCFVPQKCCKTKKRLWMTKAYRARRVITGPGEPVIEDRWLNKEAFMMCSLKGNFQ